MLSRSSVTPRYVLYKKKLHNKALILACERHLHFCKVPDGAEFLGAGNEVSPGQAIPCCYAAVNFVSVHTLIDDPCQIYFNISFVYTCKMLHIIAYVEVLRKQFCNVILS